MNSRGQVTGTADAVDGHEHAFLYSNGPLVDLSPGDGYSDGNAINDRGQVTGKVWTSDSGGRAFVYSGGALQKLNIFPIHVQNLTYYNPSVGFGINSRGQITGEVENYGPHAFLYSRGRAVNVGMLGGKFLVPWVGNAINRHGQITGNAEFKSRPAEGHVYLYEDGIIRDLGALSGGRDSWGLAINDKEEIVGGAYVGGLIHAFLYSEGTMKDIQGSVPLINKGIARGINNKGAVIFEGVALYRQGKLLDLNKLIDARFGWYLNESRGINDAGQIVGYGMHNGQRRAFLLTPKL